MSRWMPKLSIQLLMLIKKNGLDDCLKNYLFIHNFFKVLINTLFMDLSLVIKAFFSITHDLLQNSL